MKTRDEARTAWAASGLTYADLTLDAMRSLRKSINTEMAESGLIDGTYRCHLRPTIKRDASGSVRWADIRCRSRYFYGRQAITFEENGFVGIAGWADDANVQPVIVGFARWLKKTQRPESPSHNRGNDG